MVSFKLTTLLATTAFVMCTFATPVPGGNVDALAARTISNDVPRLQARVLKWRGKARTKPLKSNAPARGLRWEGQKKVKNRLASKSKSDAESVASNDTPKSSQSSRSRSGQRGTETFESDVDSTANSLWGSNEAQRDVTSTKILGHSNSLGGDRESSSTSEDLGA